MQYVIVLKYGEIVLKGLNRGRFEQMLMKRVRQSLRRLPGKYEIRNSQSTIMIHGDENADMLLAAEKMKKIFGIVSVCVGYECEKDMGAICALVREKAAELTAGAKTFKCVAKRSDKDFPFISPQICELCGAEVLSAVRGIKVDVNSPEAVVTVEVRDRSAFIHGKGAKGAGGMPTGSNGRALLLLSGGIDSPVAGHMVAKRGVYISAVYFESPPYTGEAAKEKVKSLAKVLAGYTGTVTLYSVSVTEIQQELVEKCEERLFTLLLRRFMMRLALEVAKQAECTALITGESLGQVASQTMEAIMCTDTIAHIPVFRPCIGLDKEEIIQTARRIGTFDISSLPYEDCCTVFTPKHPKLDPAVAELEAEETKLDIKGLVERAMQTLSFVRVHGDADTRRAETN